MANISETKTPTPGEWWLRNSGGRIVFICGFDPDGWVVHCNQNVGCFSSKMRFFCKEFRHEPRCTGFGWVEPPEETVRTIDRYPGDGYRWLEDDEIVTPTDEVFRPDLSPCWVKPLTRAGYTVTYRGSDDYWVRRSIARTQPVEPIAIDPGEGYELLPVGTRLERYDQVFASGMTGPSWMDTVYMLERIGSRPALKGPYRRKIKPVESPAEDPDDMPLNPVPGKVVATGTVTFTPVTPSDNMAAIIAEHTQQVRELTQRIGELARQVNERDAMIEQIRTALHQGYFV